MTGFRIVPTTTDAHVAGYNRCLDLIARERRWFGIVEGPPLAVSAEFVEELRVRRGVHVVALDERDDVVGWCDVVRHTREGFQHAGRLAMGIVPEARGRGLGAALMAAALAAAAAAGIERVELEVYATNARARALYARMGFVEEGYKRGARKLDGAYDDNVLMVRWLVDPPASPPEVSR